MKQIPLTQGKFALVDDKDFDFLNQWKWHLEKDGNIFYAIRRAKNPESKNPKYPYKRLAMHNVLVEGYILDHKDGNGLNNQRENLRPATKKQNAMNIPAHKDSFSRFKGISWYKRGKKWKAQIFIDGKNKHLGYFEVETEAAAAYNTAAKEIFGEYARLNKITCGG